MVIRICSFLLKIYPVYVRVNMWFQHDGAPAHSIRLVRNYLNDTFQERWIGRSGPINWPAQSPDLTPLDFFLCGHIKNHVYQTTPATFEDIKRRIRPAFRSITALLNVRRELPDRLHVCIQYQGRNFEQYL